MINTLNCSVWDYIWWHHFPPISFQVVTLRCKRRWHEGRSKAIEADESVAGEVCALFAGWETIWKNEHEDVKNEMLHMTYYDDYPWSLCHVLWGMRYHNGPLVDIPKARIKLIIHQRVAKIMTFVEKYLIRKPSHQNDWTSQAPGFFRSTTQPNGSPRGAGQSSQHATRTEEGLIHLQIESCKMSGSLCWLVEILQENNVSKLTPFCDPKERICRYSGNLRVRNWWFHLQLPSPAQVMQDFGGGRVVAISPHPEST